ncbi:hypothetical protein [Curtobacterium sp. MCBD17_040]|uniref:hypothetical protein n=1 Tax=Curtobacterium sp. MCBD17_040 TaxID=2175674 RepID=UPI000DA8762B|nr:hypothetical protein [Curtobacterium sp. MCBD17_040]WIB65617.1 hypothetical protein DEI94_15980 [Curtobacterium sp. MCBD17_040]
MNYNADLDYLQQQYADGTLDASIGAALQHLGVDLHLSPTERAWWENYDDYEHWLDTHDGRHPQVDDEDAAGLTPWLNAQDDVHLTLRQRAALRAIPGWTRTAQRPEWADAWALLLQLADETSAAGAAELQELSALVDVGRAAGHQPRTGPISRVHSTAAVLTYLIFCIQSGRQPEYQEPSGQWLRRARRDSRFQELLPVIPGFTDAVEPAPAFVRRTGEYLEAVNADGPRTPRQRRAIRWMRDQRAKLRRGTLGQAESRHLADQLSG